MKGVLFNVVEDVVDDTQPPDTWDHILVDAGVDGAYTSLGDYHGAEMAAIVAALAERSDQSPEEVLRAVGEHGYRYLAERHPDLVAEYSDYDDLLAHLDDVIHPEVLKLYPRADPPKFEVTTHLGDAWTVVYRSRRGLCHLADGLLRGAAEAHGIQVVVEQTTCAHRGDDACTFEVLRVETRG